MSATATISTFAVGAAGIGFWIVARFPSFGPRRFITALVALVAVSVLQTPVLSVVGSVIAAVGVAGALLFVVLPSLTALFWASGCLVRSLVLLMTPHQR